MQVNPDVEKAYRLARTSRIHSHSPYSKFAVGGAVKVAGQEVFFAGCNIENASFGATICAERVALHSAVSSGHRAFEFLIVVTNESEATVPCALCLQSLAEFCSNDFVIYLANEAAILKAMPLKSLLPYPFRNFTAVKK